MSLQPRRAFVWMASGLLLAFAPPALAASSGEAQDFTIHQHFVSPRALGMGNAFTAVADDYAALFYNPAGLALLQEWEMNFEVRAMVDKDVIKFSQDVQKVAQTEDPVQINNFLDDHYGKHFSSRLPTLGWFLAGKGWGLGVIPADLSLELSLHQTVGPAIGAVATQDTTIAFGLADDFKIGKEKFYLGANVKAIYRGYFNKFVNALDLALDSDILRPEDATEGLTFDSDIGFLYSPPVPKRGFFKFLKFAKPTFGATVRNVADYGFTQNLHFIDEHSGKPPPLGRRFDVGSKFELPDWWVFKTRFAADVRDIGHENWTIGKGLHVGAEFIWKIAGWWRGGWRVGLNQGYMTAGFAGKLGIFMLDVVTYGEEVGPSDRKQESRRYMVKASLDF